MSKSESKSEAPDFLRPKHYHEGRKFDPFDVCNDWDLPMTLGTAIKYIARHGRKKGESSTKDLRKALECIAREILFLEEKARLKAQEEPSSRISSFVQEPLSTFPHSLEEFPTKCAEAVSANYSQVATTHLRQADANDATQKPS